MKRLIVLLLLSINISALIFASPADPTPRKVIQPNGDTIFVSLHGDEFGSWYEDERGNIIDVDSNNYWVYVSVENNNKVLTNQIVSQISMPIDINRCKFKNEVQNFGFILTLVNQTLKKPAGLPSGWGRAAPKERKM